MENISIELNPMHNSKAVVNPKQQASIKKSRSGRLTERITSAIRVLLAVGLALLLIYSIVQAAVGLFQSIRNPTLDPREPNSDLKRLQSVLGILQQEAYKTGLLPVAGASFSNNEVNEQERQSPQRAQWWRRRNGLERFGKNKTTDQPNISNTRRPGIVWWSESAATEPSQESWNPWNKSESSTEHFKGQQNLYTASTSETEIQTKSNNSLGN